MTTAPTRKTHNMSYKPDTAFILAAGLGTRLRPLTDHQPKPMVEIHGKPMLGHALDALENCGVKTCVINTHYHAHVIDEYLQKRKGPKTIISYEEILLDTGGGIQNMLQHFSAPFYVLSGDSIWQDPKDQPSALDALAQHWDDEKMDILILLQPLDTMHLTKGIGDYDLDADGRAIRSLNKKGRYMFTSIRINSPRIFSGAPQGKFSYLTLLDEAQKNGRLYGLVHQGQWHHISTPEDVRQVNERA